MAWTYEADIADLVSTYYTYAYTILSDGTILYFRQPSTSAIQTYYSTDNGQSFTLCSTTHSDSLSTSLVLKVVRDENDYIWMTYRDGSGIYRITVGTWNGTDDISWEADQSLGSVSNPSMVAFVVDGDSYCVMSWADSPYIALLMWTYDGATLSQHHASRDIFLNQTGSSPSGNFLDWTHDGDGYTNPSPTTFPDIYCSWSSGGTGASSQYGSSSYDSGNGWYSASTNETSYSNSSLTGPWPRYDGDSTVYIVMQPNLGDRDQFYLHAWDLTDDSNTQLTSIDFGWSTTPGGGHGGYDHACMDAPAGKIHLVEMNEDDKDLEYTSYDIATDTWSSITNIRSAGHTVLASQLASQPHSCYVSSAIGGPTVVWIEDDTTDWIGFAGDPNNLPPTATLTSPASGEDYDIEDVLDITWTYSDPDSDAQTHYAIKRITNALTTEYWDGDSWESTETKIAGASLTVSLPKNWGSASDSQYEFQVKVWDAAGNASSYSTGVVITPSSSSSTSKGLSLPRPYKKQENVMATLRSNNEYMLSWVNTYLPAYGDVDDDLYLKGGVRPGGQSTMRDMFPPIVGEYDLGNGTNYFNALGATNIYRTNEFSLSSEKFKKFISKEFHDALGFVNALDVEEFAYADKRRMNGANRRIGLVAEDVEEAAKHFTQKREKYSFVHEDDDGNKYVNDAQLMPVLWQAVQELYALIESVIPEGRKDELAKYRAFKARERARSDK